MTVSTAPTPSAQRVTSPRVAVARVAAPSADWIVPLTLLASTCIVVGLIWDISWHRSVGRDTFWTYPHVLEQLAAIISGVGCGWLVLWTTFSQSPEARSARDAGVGFWGFRGPLGAWVCIWGTMMMIISAPFDNWWHDAYGLDVKIVSPPHSILAAGMIAIELGAMLMALAAQNRATEATKARLNAMFLYGAGVIVAMQTTVIMEYASLPNAMHSPLCHQLTSLLLPVLFVAFSLASKERWAATWIAVVYMGIVLILMWTLQLFPATPRLAPIYNPITHMVPPPFPLLLVVPAFALDLLRPRIAHRSTWMQAVVLGVAFFALMLLVQWYFAEFMLSPAARNWFFAAGQWDYNARPGPWQHEFFRMPRDPNGHVLMWPMIGGFTLAAGFAVLSSRAGIGVGRLLAMVKR